MAITENSMKHMDTLGNLYTTENAEKIAASMQDAYPDWTYIVKHDQKGTGYSFIEVYDNNNEFIGKL